MQSSILIHVHVHVHVPAVIFAPLLISAKSAVGSGRPPVGALGGGISVGGGGGGAPGGGGGGGPPLGGGGAEETEVSSVPYKKIDIHNMVQRSLHILN